MKKSKMLDILSGLVFLGGCVAMNFNHIDWGIGAMVVGMIIICRPIMVE